MSSVYRAKELRLDHSIVTVAPSWNEVLSRALSKAPCERFQTVRPRSNRARAGFSCRTVERSELAPFEDPMHAARSDATDANADQANDRGEFLRLEDLDAHPGLGRNQFLPMATGIIILPPPLRKRLSRSSSRLYLSYERFAHTSDHDACDVVESFEAGVESFIVSGEFAEACSRCEASFDDPSLG